MSWVLFYPECGLIRPTDKFKEENWNLEVTLQELRAQLSDSQASANRLESDHRRVTNLLAADRTKAENERLNVLGEHDKVIQDIKKKEDDLERTIETLQSALGAQGRDAGEPRMLFLSGMC